MAENSLEGYLAEARSVCAQVSSLKHIADRLQALEVRLATKEIVVPLVGEFSSGKSTLINAILGKQVLPVDITPTTATINEIRFSQAKEFAEIYSNGQKTKELSDITQLSSEEYSKASLVKIFSSSSAVGKSIVLVDPPGLSSDIARHDKLLFEYLPDCDAALLVIDVNQGALTRTTQNFLETVKFIDKDVYVVFTKTDLKPMGELDELKKYAETKLPIKPRGVAFTSARNGDIEQLLAILEKIGAQSHEVLTRNIRSSFYTTCSEALSLLDGLIDSAKLDTTELNEQIRKVRKELERIEEEIERSLRDARRNCREAVLSAVELFKQRLVSNLGWLTDTAFQEPAKLESNFDEAVGDAGRAALKSYESQVGTALKTLEVDIKAIAEKVDVGNVALPKTLTDSATFAMTAVILDLLLPGGLVWGVVARLFAGLLSRYARFAALWAVIEAPVRQIATTVIKAVTRSYVERQVMSAIDQAVLKFSEILEAENDRILEVLETQIRERFNQAGKDLVASLEALKSEKAKKVQEFQDYLRRLRESKDVLSKIVEDLAAG